MATCYRHPSRETGVSCSNCGRPICPDCMTTTPVGMRCPECASQRTKVVRMRETPSGPVVTYALIAINVIVFLAEGGGALSISGSPSGSLYEKGSLFGSIPRVPELGVAYGEWWRIVSSGFLHANLLHIAFNMWVLYYLGVMLEPALGRARFCARVRRLAAVRLVRRPARVSPHVPTVGRLGRHLRPDGRRRGRAARPSDPHLPDRGRGPDRAQPDHQLQRPRHLVGRTYRRPHRRRAVRRRAALRGRPATTACWVSSARPRSAWRRSRARSPRPSRARSRPSAAPAVTQLNQEP